MKTILAVGLAGLLGWMLIAVLHADVPFAAKAFSQIYIHGTPVCVIQQRHRIVAQVGECDETEVLSDRSDREFTGEAPFHGRPGRNLPPGHPPIDGNMFPEGNRRVLI